MGKLWRNSCMEEGIRSAKIERVTALERINACSSLKAPLAVHLE